MANNMGTWGTNMLGTEKNSTHITSFCLHNGTKDSQCISNKNKTKLFPLLPTGSEDSKLQSSIAGVKVPCLLTLSQMHLLPEIISLIEVLVF